MDNLTPRQLRAVSLIATGVPLTEVAAQVGVRPSTISVWKAKPAFQAHLERLRARTAHDVAELLKASALQAAETLSELARSAKSEATRLRAAVAVLELCGLNAQPPILKLSEGSTQPYDDAGDFQRFLRAMTARVEAEAEAEANEREL